MSSNQRFAPQVEETFTQKYNFGNKVIPHGTTLDEFLKSTAFIESTPNNFAFSCPGPRNLPLTRQFEQYVSFAEKNPVSPPIQNSIFPLFCHVVMKLKQKDDPAATELFITTFLHKVPAQQFEEANLFVSDEEFCKKMSNLFSTQRYKISCSDDDAAKIKAFLSESGHSQLRLLYTSIIIFVPLRHQEDDRLVHPRFPLSSPTSSMCVVQARINSATFAAISQEDPTVYACCNDQNILKIDSNTQKVTHLYTHSSAVTTLSLSNRSKVLLTADLCGNISLWSSTATCQLNTKFTQVLCSSFAPHGGMFAIGSGSGLIHLYDTPRHKLHRILIGHSAAVTNLSFHPNCSLIGSLAMEPEIRLWDLREAATVRLFSGQAQKNSALAFSNDGKSLAVFDGELAVHDIGSQKLIFRKPLHTATDIISMHFSMDSQYIYTVGQHGEITVCDTTSENWPTKELFRLNERVVSAEMLKADEFRIVTSYDFDTQQ